MLIQAHVQDDVERESQDLYRTGRKAIPSPARAHLLLLYITELSLHQRRLHQESEHLPQGENGKEQR